MSPLTGLLLASSSGLGVGFAWHTYMRRELRVPASPYLVCLRSLALVTVIVLLFDLRIGGGGARVERFVLLDESASMTAGGVAASRARELVADYEEDGWRSLRFDDSELAPALRRAVELGAGEIVVVSDLRLHDRVEATSALADLPVTVEFEAVDQEVVNAGVRALEVGDAPVPGGTVEATVEIFGEGADSAVVELLGGGTPALQRIGLPSPGRTLRIPLETVAAAEAGVTRYRARISIVGGATGAAADAFAADDEITADGAVGHRVGAVVLVSELPDWEPRHLLSAFAEVTGLPAAGYLSAGDGLWAPTGTASERTPPVDWNTVRNALADAAVIIAHQVRDGDGELASEIAASSAPALVIPRSPSAAGLTGISVGAPVGGEWYVLSQLPPSPLAAELASLPPGLPPLTDLLISAGPSDALPALEVTRAASTEHETAIHLVSRGDRRMALVAAGGFWRWAMRPEARDTYRQLWSAIAGWLLSGRAVEAAEAAEPHILPSPELIPTPMDLRNAFENRPPTADGAAVGSPLRTAAWPYLLVLGLICTEWYVRRRSGLR